MATLLRDPKTYKHDILAIQEPWKNLFTATTHYPAKEIFDLYCLGGTEEKPTRVCFFVNKRISSDNIQFKEHSQDLYSITLRLNKGQQFSIFNAYNLPKITARQSVLLSVYKALGKHNNNKLMLLSNFNLHYPMWEGAHVQNIEPEAENLIAILEEFALYATFAPGTITYRKRQLQTSIDVCFVTARLVNRVVKSKVNKDLDHNSDHLLISTTLDISMPNVDKLPRKN